MTPVELLDDHARRPRNIGKLLNASAVGDVGSIVAGDALRFYVKIEGAGGAGDARAEGVGEKIAAAKFQVFNCQDQLGAASVVTELCAGLTLDEAIELTIPDVCARLGGLDHVELPPRIWAIEGLRAAIAAWRREDLPADRELDPLLCRCLGIPEETVRQAIAVRGLATVEAIVDATSAGSVCGSCRVDMPALLAPEAKPVAAAPTLSRIQLMRRIQGALEAKLLPALREAGGGLELWDLDGARVRVRASGALKTDDDARREALGALEALLRAEVDPTLEVAE
jgi:NifU-like protein